MLLLAIRPTTLLLSITPVLAGLALAATKDKVILPLAFITLITAILIQISTNLLNDIKDAESNLDNPNTRLGPTRVCASGFINPKIVAKWAYYFMLLSLLTGLYLCLHGGIIILAIGLLSLLCAYAYSAGPYPISATPFGELFVIVFFGIFAVAGSYYLQVHSLVDYESYLIGLAFGCPAAAVLLLNNCRDQQQDKLVGRHTLVMYLSQTAVNGLYFALLLLPLLLLFALNYINIWLFMLGILVAIVLSIKFSQNQNPIKLNSLLKLTSLYSAYLLIVFSISVL